MPENPKLLKTSILGVPNVGKSTLVNRLMNRRVIIRIINFNSWGSCLKFVHFS